MTEVSDGVKPAVLGVIVGSLRGESVTRRLAQRLMEVAPASLSPRFIEIGDLPLYNEDLDIEVSAEPPAQWARFRDQVRTSDAILFVTPEYNRSVPAPLKNAIDVGSAPHDQNAFDGLPAAIVSASPGRMGAFGANHHLRQSLVFLDMPTMQQPELYLGGSYGLFGERGELSDPKVADMLTAYMSRFGLWVHRHSRVAA
ncbi:NADPH-dependent FMN reductase [Leifsonia aquatica]|uniref:NADPH-dependent FMN reductase n=1 Tax=Leifsonia aquatica TaxID=144185 RepID=UPI000468AA43|nr:NAD(P)H-dependent oxidoreductase [Leifsonia aquatica]